MQNNFYSGQVMIGTDKKGCAVADAAMTDTFHSEVKDHEDP